MIEVDVISQEFLNSIKDGNLVKVVIHAENLIQCWMHSSWGCLILLFVFLFLNNNLLSLVLIIGVVCCVKCKYMFTVLFAFCLFSPMLVYWIIKLDFYTLSIHLASSLFLLNQTRCSWRFGVWIKYWYWLYGFLFPYIS